MYFRGGGVMEATAGTVVIGPVLGKESGRSLEG